jgi:hypothetical protein
MRGAAEAWPALVLTMLVHCSRWFRERPALVAQGIEHRPPEPGAQVRILPGAPVEIGPDQHRRAGRGFRLSTFAPAVEAPSSLGVRAARSVSPSSVGTGGTNFLTQTGTGTWLVCSGAGPAPWPHPDLRRVPTGTVGVWRLVRATPDVPTKESALFSDVVDDRGDHYHLSPGGSSGASDSGGKWQRLHRRAIFGPMPTDDTLWLEFDTAGGPVRAPLLPSFEVSTRHLEPPLSTVERQTAPARMAAPPRPGTPPGPTRRDRGGADLGRRRPSSCGRGRDRRRHDRRPTGRARTPPVLAAALTADPGGGAWQQVAALGLIVDHPDNGKFGLEALVGHPDRLVAHFVQGSIGTGTAPPSSSPRPTTSAAAMSAMRRSSAGSRKERSTSARRSIPRPLDSRSASKDVPARSTLPSSFKTDIRKPAAGHLEVHGRDTAGGMSVTISMLSGGLLTGLRQRPDIAGMWTPFISEG